MCAHMGTRSGIRSWIGSWIGPEEEQLVSAICVLDNNMLTLSVIQINPTPSVATSLSIVWAVL